MLRWEEDKNPSTFYFLNRILKNWFPYSHFSLQFIQIYENSKKVVKSLNHDIHQCSNLQTLGQ